jgi:homocysteine S-methyltransferase
VEDITRVMTAASHPAILSPQGVNLEELPVPSALGINCTSPAYVGELSRRFTEALRTLEPKMEIGFVLYPDGGLTYNPVTKTWHAPSSNSEPAGSDAVAGDQSWAHKLGSVAVELSSASTKGDAATQLPVWNEIIVGGCCKAGYDEIRGLKEWIAAADI